MILFVMICPYVKSYNNIWNVYTNRNLLYKNDCIRSRNSSLKIINFWSSIAFWPWRAMINSDQYLSRYPKRNKWCKFYSRTFFWYHFSTALTSLWPIWIAAFTSIWDKSRTEPWSVIRSYFNLLISRWQTLKFCFYYFR